MSKFPGKNPDWMINQYVQLRDKKRRIEAKHKEEMKKFSEVMAALELELLDAMKKAGLESMKCEHGTAYQSTRWSTKVVDWSATLSYIQKEAAWDLLEQRVNKTAVVAVMEESQQTVPGVDVSSEVVCNVRRPNERS